MELKSAEYSGIYTGRLSVHKDSRGCLSRLFCAEELSAAGLKRPIAQINLSESPQAGTFRGMHFQLPPFAEFKIIICLQGAIQDFAIDLRQDSTTFLNCFSVKLSRAETNFICIPEGFAHGFQTLTDNVQLLYLHSAPYNNDSERGINYLDPRLNMELPLPVSVISERDRSFPMLTSDYKGVAL